MAIATDIADSAARLKPPLKWAGGKRWLVPHLERLWSPYRARRLVEPLCGGLAVTLGLMPARALINDINPHAINFYRRLQRGLRVLIPLRNEPELYYAHRERFNALIRAGAAASSEAAALFYYLNRTGYNGLCRFNRKGEFNVPFGRHKQISYKRDFTDYRSMFADWRFQCGDFAAIKLDADDFVYADPPYDVQFTQYSMHPFGWAEQVRFAQWLAAHRGPVVLSNQATPRILKLYEELGFTLKLLHAPRMISCNGDRAPALEVLATKGR